MAGEGELEYDRPPLASDMCHLAHVLGLQVGEVFALTLCNGRTSVVAIVWTKETSATR